MKNLLTRLCVLTAMAIFGCVAQAQTQTARQLYLGYENNDKIAQTSKAGGKAVKVGKPGAKVIIERSRNGKISFVSPNSLFRSGDKIRLRFETNFNGYLAIVNVSPSGDLKLLFPYEGADATIKPSKNTRIPKGDDWIVFDENPGIETLTVIMAKSEIVLESEAELRKLNEQATSTRDLYVESNAEATYAVSATATIAKPVGFTLRLKHGK